jgi:hypothetical protein
MTALMTMEGAVEAAVLPELTEADVDLACGCELPAEEGSDALRYGLRNRLRTGYRNGWDAAVSRLRALQPPTTREVGR